VDQRQFSTVVPLLYNADPAIRRVAVRTLADRAGVLDPAGVEYLLYHAVDDGDGTVAAAAAEALLAVRNGAGRSRNLALAAAAESAAATINDTSRTSIATASSLGLDLPDLRFAAASSMASVVEKLHDIALTATNGDLATGAVTVLGKLAFEGSLEVLFKAAERKRTSVAAIHALANFSAEEVFALLKGVFARLDIGPAGVDVLESLAKFGFSDVYDFLAQRAADPNPAVRAAAARGLGQRLERGAEKLLVDMLRDGDADVVAAAVDGLALLGRPSAADELKRCIEPDQPADLRIRTLEALGYLRSRYALPWMYAQLGDPDPAVVAAAVEALGRFDLGPVDAVQHFKHLLGHEAARVRAAALVVMARADEGLALATLKKMFDSPSRDMRAAAARAVGFLGRAEPIKWLVTLVNTESEGPVLQQALASLTRVAEPKARDALKHLLRHANADVRAEALGAFARVADETALGDLEAMVTLEKDERVRARLVGAMGRLCGPDNYLYVTRVLQDRSPVVVCSAVETMDCMGLLQATPFLTPLLHHGHHGVRAAAVVALWKLGDLKVTATLDDLLSSHEEGPERSALGALRQMADFLQPVLLEERPLLLSALKEQFTRASVSVNRVDVGQVALELEKSLTGVPAFDAALQGYEAATAPLGRTTAEEEQARPPVAGAEAEPVRDYVPTTAQGPILGELLRERSRGKGGDVSSLLLKLLALEPDHPIGRYLALKYMSSNDEAAVVKGDDLRRCWDASRFLPGLCVLVNRSQRKGDERGFLSEYLSLLGVAHRVYGDLLATAHEHLARGDEAGALKVVKFLVQRMPLNTDLHAKVGDLALELGELDASLEHALSAFAANQRDWRSAVLACSIAVRQGKMALAACLADVLTTADGVDERYVKKAWRLQDLIAGRGPRTDAF